MWDFKDGFTDDENNLNAQKCKYELETAASVIDGIIAFEVNVCPLKTSNRDIVLNSLFESEGTLAAYQVHPAHICASSYVGSVMKNRSCIDYYE